MENGGWPLAESDREERERRKRKRRKKAIEIRIHAQVGRERMLASIIPAMKDKEIHNNGMCRFYIILWLYLMQQILNAKSAN